MARKTWRDSPGMSTYNRYKKHFAYRPVVTTDGTRVWWKNYYSVQSHWFSTYESSMHHIEAAGTITEAEYLIRKLTEGV